MSLIGYAGILAGTRLRQITAVSKAIIKRQISYYPNFVLKFEKRCAAYFGREYALTYCNGTSAIEAAVFALGLGEGDEVIVPSCTFHASIDPIINVGATPIFVDVDENSFTICPQSLIAAITDRTRAVIVVHLFGIPADMSAIQQALEGREIAVVEDASHAHGARIGETMIGAWSDIAAFSMQGSKAVAAGEGGIALTAREDLFLRLSLYGHFDRHSKEFEKIGAQAFRYTGLGHKRRMAPVSALIAEGDMHYLDRVNALMRTTAAQLDAALADVVGIKPATICDGGERGGFFSGYPINVERKGGAEEAIAALRKRGIEASGYPFQLHHKLAVYRDYRLRQALRRNKPLPDVVDSDQVLPVTEKLRHQMILLPRRYLITLNKKKLATIRATLMAL